MLIKNCFKGKIRLRYFILGLLTIFVLDYFGVFTHLFELSFATQFRYPYEGNIESSIKQLQQGLKPDIEPINNYNQSFISACDQKCHRQDNIRLVILVKSAIDNFDRRKAIRNTWGFESRFSDVPIRTVFLVGMSVDSDSLITLLQEKEVFNDIVHIDFIDDYFNNTLKIMNGMRWACKICPYAKYYFFVDDDYYVSIKNLLRFLRHPVSYPTFLKSSHDLKSKYIDPYSLELPKNVIFYAGHVFLSSPHRHRSSKWYVSLADYPFDQWPPYVTAGAFVLSKDALLKLFYTSFYVKHFKFDDIFLGIVAYKAGVELFHSEHFRFYKKLYSAEDFKFVIAAHGFEEPAELFRVWNEQKAVGNA